LARKEVAADVGASGSVALGLGRFPRRAAAGALFFFDAEAASV